MIERAARRGHGGRGVCPRERDIAGDAVSVAIDGATGSLATVTGATAVSAPAAFEQRSVYVVDAASVTVDDPPLSIDVPSSMISQSGESGSFA